MMADLEVQILYCSNEMVFKKAKCQSWDPTRLLVNYWQQHYSKSINNAKSWQRKKKIKACTTLQFTGFCQYIVLPNDFFIFYNRRIPDFGARIGQQNSNKFQI